MPTKLLLIRNGKTYLLLAGVFYGHWEWDSPKWQFNSKRNISFFAPVLCHQGWHLSLHKYHGRPSPFLRCPVCYEVTYTYKTNCQCHQFGRNTMRNFITTYFSIKSIKPLLIRQY